MIRAMTDLSLSLPARFRRLKPVATTPAPSVPLRHSLILATATFLAGLAAPFVHDAIRPARPDTAAIVPVKPIAAPAVQRQLVDAAGLVGAQKTAKLTAEDREIMIGARPETKAVAVAKPVARPLALAEAKPATCPVAPAAPAQPATADRLPNTMDMAAYAAALASSAAALNAVSAAMDGALQQ